MGSQWMALAGRRWERARRTRTSPPVGQGEDGCAEAWSASNCLLVCYRPLAHYIRAAKSLFFCVHTDRRGTTNVRKRTSVVTQSRCQTRVKN